MNKLTRFLFKKLFLLKSRAYNILKVDPIFGNKLMSMDKIRLGTPYGGWVIPKGLIKASSICYDFGAGEDISFSTEIVNNFKCNVHIFDPTPKAIEHFNDLKSRTLLREPMPVNNSRTIIYKISPKDIKKLHFHEYGIWS